MDDEKLKRMSASERYKEVAQMVAELAQEDLSSIELVAIRQEYYDKYKFRIGDFKEIYRNERKKVLEQRAKDEENKKREEIEQTLRKTKATLTDIHEGLRKITSTSGDLIEIVMAVVISMRASEVNGLPMFWILIVDVPSGDKTTHLMMFELAPFVICRDSVTPGAFGSGYVDPKTGQKLGSEFLQELNGKCFVCKDYSSLFSGRAEKVQEFIGAMTNIYDQQFKKQTGTVGETGADKCAFAHAAAITDLALDKHQRYISTLGPRFYMFRQEPSTHVQEKKGFDLLWGAMDVKGAKEQLKEMCSAYAFQLWGKADNYFKEVEMDEALKNYVEKLSKLQSRLRGVSHWGGGEGFNAEFEKPYRALQQLRTILISLTRIHGRKRVTEHEKELLRRIVLASGPNNRIETLAIYRNPSFTKDGKLTVNNCKVITNKSYNAAKNILNELTALGILERRGFEMNDPFEGNDEYCWMPKPEYFDIIVKPFIELDHVEDLKRDDSIA